MRWQTWQIKTIQNVIHDENEAYKLTMVTMAKILELFDLNKTILDI